MADPKDVLTPFTQTALVNEIKRPNQALRDGLWGQRISLPTENISYDEISKGRESAPFVQVGAQAHLVSGHTEKFRELSATNIRIKKSFSPHLRLFRRRPGEVIFRPSSDSVVSPFLTHVARELGQMEDMIRNAEELLCSQALQGTISYTVAPDNDVFTVTYPKPAGNNITLSVFWDDATIALPTPIQDLHAVKRVFSDEVGLQPTDCYLGSEAADNLIRLAKGQSLLLDKREVQMGSIDFASRFADSGLIFLGTLAGIRFWEYSRTVTLPDGTTTPMIRAKYGEFVSQSPASERVMYYAAIPDWTALDGRNIATPRFSKSWDIQDPSSRQNLVHSRPLPVPRRAGAMVSVKLVSG